jgi:Ca2+-transporting ATPase
MSQSALPKGLSDEEAARRLLTQGPNEIEGRERHGLLSTLRGVASEPMFLLLLVAAAIYLVLGDFGEGLLLAFFAMATVGLVIFQERRSEHALDALRVLASPQVRVVRGGQVRRIAARELVPGDIFLVSEGERLAADGIARGAGDLSIDESLLTGESAPVRKRASQWHVSAGTEPVGGNDTPDVYASTLAVSGHGVIEVLATGRDTRVGRIGASLARIETAPTPLQRHLRRLVQVFGAAAALTSAALVVWYGLQRGNWMQGVLSAIALGMAMLPEEFPMALTVFLALGAWRLARIKVLSRRPAVIEALGAATVLCVDKTGTLTENRMQLRRLVTEGADFVVKPEAPLPEDVHRLLEFGMLASRRGGIDPMDRALLGRGDGARRNRTSAPRLAADPQIPPQRRAARDVERMDRRGRTASNCRQGCSRSRVRPLPPEPATDRDPVGEGARARRPGASRARSGRGLGGQRRNCEEAARLRLHSAGSCRLRGSSTFERARGRSAGPRGRHRGGDDHG